MKNGSLCLLGIILIFSGALVGKETDIELEIDPEKILQFTEHGNEIQRINARSRIDKDNINALWEAINQADARGDVDSLILLIEELIGVLRQRKKYLADLDNRHEASRVLAEEMLLSAPKPRVIQFPEGQEQLTRMLSEAYDMLPEPGKKPEINKLTKALQKSREAASKYRNVISRTLRTKPITGLETASDLETHAYAFTLRRNLNTYSQAVIDLQLHALNNIVVGYMNGRGNEPESVEPPSQGFTEFFDRYQENNAPQEDDSNPYSDN